MSITVQECRESVMQSPIQVPHRSSQECFSKHVYWRFSYYIVFFYIFFVSVSLVFFVLQYNVVQECPRRVWQNVILHECYKRITPEKCPRASHQNLFDLPRFAVCVNMSFIFLKCVISKCVVLGVVGFYQSFFAPEMRQYH